MMGRFYFAKDDPALKKKATKKATHKDNNNDAILRMPMALEDVWATGFWRTLFQQESTHKAKALVRKGVPIGHRGEVWKLSTLASVTQKKTPELYKLLCEGKSKYEEYIQQDLHRTLKSHVYFKSGEGEAALYNVLNAYSKFDNQAGYTQGMSFIAAVLLLNMDEESAFWCLVDIMRKYLLRPDQHNDHTLLRQSLYQMNRLIEIHLPKIYGHFIQEGVDSSLFASSWFSTLFAYTFPLPAVVRVWDVLFLEDSSYIFALGLAILRHTEKDLITLSSCEDISKYLKQCSSKLEVEEVIKTADAIGLCAADLFSLEIEFKDPSFLKELADFTVV